MTLPDSVNSIARLVLFVLGAYILAFYVGLIVWTARDIASRSRDWLVRILGVLLVAAFNVPGLVLYLVLRPRETLADVYGRALEEEALLQNIEDQMACPSCRRRVAQDFAVCPYCRTTLRNHCANCNRLVDPRWDVCPYCGKETATGLASSSTPADLSATTSVRPDEAPSTTG